MKILDLVLKGNWYDMIDSGVKKEEYREKKPYWTKRLKWERVNAFYGGAMGNSHSSIMDGYKKFDAVRFRRGYTNITMLFKHNATTEGVGTPDWGAPEKEVYIIKLGNRINDNV